ncbi:RNA polymerase sigma factor [Castellaniella sp. GW247-6E4]|uniref:RNA polymerase sigma factor n=1 Tax=Castellaniella sp. GW247-6E4 TaxID=3140380 RepID=UPI0033162D1E
MDAMVIGTSPDGSTGGSAGAGVGGVDEDAAEIAGIRAGDAQAFERLMRRHNTRMYRAARGILKNETEAEDAVQEAYWKAYLNIGKFRADARFSTWLTRIVINESLMRLRRNKRRAQFIQSDMETQFDPMDGAQGAVDGNPAQAAWRGEVRRLIEQRLDELPDDYRVVFMLRAIEEMPAVEVAGVLGIPEATVRTRYFRARRLMRGALSRDMDMCGRDAFSFAGGRCDRIVAAVLARLAAAQSPDSEGHGAR